MKSHGYLLVQYKGSNRFIDIECVEIETMPLNSFLFDFNLDASVLET